MQCPQDGTLLSIAHRSGVEIDYCPQCRGVWLERGELDKVLDEAERVGTRRPEFDDRDRDRDRDRNRDRDRDRDRDQYRDRDRDDWRSDDRHRCDPRRRRRKEGWLGELFDFD